MRDILLSGAAIIAAMTLYPPPNKWIGLIAAGVLVIMAVTNPMWNAPTIG